MGEVQEGEWLGLTPPDNQMESEVTLVPAGDLAVSIEFESVLSPEVNARVRALDHLLLKAKLPGVLETVPTFRSLLVYYDPLVIAWDHLTAFIQTLIPHARPERIPPGRRVEVPCSYGGRHGPDLEAAAERLHLDPDALIRLHTGAELVVAFLGFTPGLPYLMGLPTALNLPRLTTPRTKIPAGSVGIAGNQGVIYSVESPGGFWILGQTPLALYDPQAAEPILLRPGDRLRFVPVAAESFQAMRRAVVAGTYHPLIEEPPERPA